MVKFATTPVQDVVPSPQPRQRSKRAAVRAQYEQALEQAIGAHHALVIELEEGDNPLTVRNRLRRAADALGLSDLVIRQRGKTIVAYRPQEDEAPKVGTDEALGG